MFLGCPHLCWFCRCSKSGTNAAITLFEDTKVCTGELTAPRALATKLDNKTSAFYVGDQGALRVLAVALLASRWSGVAALETRPSLGRKVSMKPLQKINWLNKVRVLLVDTSDMYVFVSHCCWDYSHPLRGGNNWYPRYIPLKDGVCLARYVVFCFMCWFDVVLRPSSLGSTTCLHIWVTDTAILGSFQQVKIGEKISGGDPIKSQKLIKTSFTWHLHQFSPR